LIGRIIEAYIDDIVVKSKKMGGLVPDLTEVFAKLRQHRVKLNPEKCIFGVPRGMLLEFVVSKLTPIRSRPLWIWGQSRTRRAYSGSRAISQL
jgi:hypothetical protein